jgi:hypothetical protein
MKNILAILIFFSIHGLAGWEFTSETRSTDDKGETIQKMIVESKVDGNHGKFIFSEAQGSPMGKTGNYLLTNDGGQTMFMVDPVNKTYMPFDMSQLMKMAGGMLNMVQGMVKMEFSEPQITVLEDKSGESIQGLATHYRKTETTYEMKMKIIGMTRIMDVETLEESWTTTKLGDTAFGAWLRNDPAPTGNEDLDRLITTAMKATEGYPLKLIQTTTTTTWNKKKTKVKDKATTHTQTSVTGLSKKSIPAAQFKIPDDYVLTEGQEQSGMGSLKEMFKGK